MLLGGRRLIEFEIVHELQSHECLGDIDHVVSDIFLQFQQFLNPVLPVDVNLDQIAPAYLHEELSLRNHSVLWVEALVHRNDVSIAQVGTDLFNDCLQLLKIQLLILLQHQFQLHKWRILHYFSQKLENLVPVVGRVVEVELQIRLHELLEEKYLRLIL